MANPVNVEIQAAIGVFQQQLGDAVKSLSSATRQMGVALGEVEPASKKSKEGLGGFLDTLKDYRKEQVAQGRQADRPSHYVALERGSLLAELAYGESAKVNSSHHQALDRVGADLRVTARASDGVIEAVEDLRPNRFAVGVQWHPEIGLADDPFSQAIFRRLVEAALMKRELDDVAGI